MKATIELNGKKTEIELTTKQAKELGLIEENKTGWEKVNNKEHYFVINIAGINSIEESNHNYDLQLYDQANYFSTEEKAKQIDKIQTLWRKMKRYADEYNEYNDLDYDWNRINKSTKYFIVYDTEMDDFYVDYKIVRKIPFAISFSSREIANSALDLFKDDLYKIINLI